MKEVCEQKTGLDQFDRFREMCKPFGVSGFLACSKQPEIMSRFLQDPMKLSMKELQAIARKVWLNTCNLFGWSTLPKALLVKKLIACMDISPYMCGGFPEGEREEGEEGCSSLSPYMGLRGGFPCQDGSDVLLLRHIICAKKINAYEAFRYDVIQASFNLGAKDWNIPLFYSISRFRNEVISNGFYSMDALMEAKRVDPDLKIINVDRSRLGTMKMMGTGWWTRVMSANRRT